MDHIYDSVDGFIHEQTTDNDRYYVVCQQGNCPVAVQSIPEKEFRYSDFEIGKGLTPHQLENERLFHPTKLSFVQEMQSLNWKLLYIRTINNSTKNWPTTIETKDNGHVEVSRYCPRKKGLVRHPYDISRSWVLVHQQNQLLVRVTLRTVTNEQGSITGKWTTQVISSNSDLGPMERVPDSLVVKELETLGENMPSLPFTNLRLGSLVDEDIGLEPEIIYLLKEIRVKKPKIPKYNNFHLFIEKIKKEFQDKVHIKDATFHYIYFDTRQWVTIATDPDIKENPDQEYYCILHSDGLSSMISITMEEAEAKVHYTLTKYAKTKYIC